MGGEPCDPGQFWGREHWGWEESHVILDNIDGERHQE